jgi:toxin ParE1/3/4
VAHRIVFLSSAEEDLEQIYDWIADLADPHTAFSYIGRIEEACETLSSFPSRGTPRDDLAPGVRTISFEGQATIVYKVERRLVRIIHVLHRGRDPSGIFFKA